MNMSEIKVWWHFTKFLLFKRTEKRIAIFLLLLGIRRDWHDLASGRTGVIAGARGLTSHTFLFQTSPAWNVSQKRLKYCDISARNFTDTRWWKALTGALAKMGLVRSYLRFVLIERKSFAEKLVCRPFWSQRFVSNLNLSGYIAALEVSIMK